MSGTLVLSLRLFIEIQEPRLHEKHADLELVVQDARTRLPELLDVQKVATVVGHVFG